MIAIKIIIVPRCTSYGTIVIVHLMKFETDDDEKVTSLMKVKSKIDHIVDKESKKTHKKEILQNRIDIIIVVMKQTSATNFDIQ